MNELELVIYNMIDALSGTSFLTEGRKKALEFIPTTKSFALPECHHKWVTTLYEEFILEIIKELKRPNLNKIEYSKYIKSISVFSNRSEKEVEENIKYYC